MHKGFIFLHADRADAVLGDAAGIADLGQQPARFGAARAADVDGIPDRGTEFLARFRRRGGGAGAVHQLFRGRAAFAPQAGKGSSGLIGADAVQDRGGHGAFVFGHRLHQRRVIQKADLIPGADLVRRGGLCPFRDNLGPLQKALRLLEFRLHHDQRRHAL